MSGGCSFARSFLAQEPRFGAGQVAQKSSFSMGFRNYVRRLFPRPRNAFWSGTSSSEILIFYGFSQITLEVFHRLFCAFSVLHCHGVSLSGGCGFARSFLAQEPRFGAGQVAQKSSFSMGFRSYVRQFFAAFFAPSPSFTAMVFPCPGLWFCAVFPHRTAFWSGTSSFGFQKLR